MAWTTPKTNWATGELVAAADMNGISENLVILGNRLANHAVVTTADDIQISISDDFVDIDSATLVLRLATTGGDVLLHFEGKVSNGALKIDVDVDGNRVGDPDNGIRRRGINYEYFSFTRLVQNLSAGAHTFKLQGKDSGAVLYSNAHFWVREI